MAVITEQKPGTKEAGLEARIMELEAKVSSFRYAEERVNEHLRRFDELDFEVFSNQKWNKLNLSHTDDVRVVWPDGHETRGIKKHIEDLSQMFVAMPDLGIHTHPVSFGSGEWTAVIGVMEGTFTRPMTTPDGKTIPPNGKKVRLSMATIARWKDGRITDEYLFWDNTAFMQQLGLAQ